MTCGQLIGGDRCSSAGEVLRVLIGLINCPQLVTRNRPAIVTTGRDSRRRCRVVHEPAANINRARATGDRRDVWRIGRTACVRGIGHG